MFKDAEDLVTAVLKKEVPTATEEELIHQLEYLRVHQTENTYLLEGPGWKQKPVFLGPYVEKKDELVQTIQKELDEFYKKELEDIIRRVSDAAKQLSDRGIEPECVWLNDRGPYPIKRVALGLSTLHVVDLPVKFHRYNEEFVVSYEHGSLVVLEPRRT